MPWSKLARVHLHRRRFLFIKRVVRFQLTQDETLFFKHPKHRPHAPDRQLVGSGVANIVGENKAKIEVERISSVGQVFNINGEANHPVIIDFEQEELVTELGLGDDVILHRVKIEQRLVVVVQPRAHRPLGHLVHDLGAFFRVEHGIEDRQDVDEPGVLHAHIP